MDVSKLVRNRPIVSLTIRPRPIRLICIPLLLRNVWSGSGTEFGEHKDKSDIFVYGTNTMLARPAWRSRVGGLAAEDPWLPLFIGPVDIGSTTGAGSSRGVLYISPLHSRTPDQSVILTPHYLHRSLGLLHYPSVLAGLVLPSQIPTTHFSLLTSLHMPIPR